MTIEGNVYTSLVVKNVRRSAQICLGDCKDQEYIKAKRWDLGNIPNWRAFSNNSVVCNDINDILDNDEFWEGYNGNGEPYGLINLDLSRKCGRLGDFEYSDPEVAGFNPSLRAGTKIITKNGIVPIETLQDTEFETKNLHGTWEKAKCWLSGRNKQLYRIKLNTGLEYYATPEHKWPVMKDGVPTKMNSQELKDGMELPYFQHTSLDVENNMGTYLDGFCIGNLYASGQKQDNKYVFRCYYGQFDYISKYIRRWLNRVCNEEFLWCDRGFSYDIVTDSPLLHLYLKKFGICMDKKRLPTCIWNCSENFRKGFIDAFFSVEGYVSTEQQYLSLPVDNDTLTNELQELFGFYGIMFSKLHNSTKNYYILNTKNNNNIKHFRNTFKLYHTDKQQILNGYTFEDTNTPNTVRIIEVELSEVYEDVWDITVFDETHCFQLSGCITGNCFSGDTMIAVADGRNMVSIKQLTEEGRDVPVYSMDPVTQEIAIKWGRNPRVTGENQKLLRVHFSGANKGEYLDVTPNHKFFTTDGREVEAKDLKKGDSIPQFKKSTFNDKYVRVYNNGKYKVEHRMIKEFYDTQGFHQNYQEGVYNGCCKTHNVVVHHKDENKANNNPDNLEITTASAHAKHHGHELTGAKNPMYGKKHTEDTKRKIGDTTLDRCKNPEFKQKLSESHTEEHRKKYSENMKSLKADWDNQRCEELEKQANETGLRTVRVNGNQLRVIRNCEACNAEFLVAWSRRGQPYCSLSCGNTKKDSIEKRTQGNRKNWEQQAKDNFHKQAMIYKDLQEKLDTVQKKDWENACREQGVSFRFQKNTPNPWICQNWKKFVEKVNDYNHRVSCVEELDGEHTVYNITVEDFHTIGITTKSSNSNWSGVYTYQCAEQSLADRETCCLAEIYLPNIDTKDELFKCVKYLYRVCKHSLSLPCPDSKDTENIVHRNMRMGIGVTGYLQATEEQKSWLPDCYKYLREFDKKYSNERGFPPSIKLTTCKPSGCSRRDMLVLTNKGLLRLDELGDVNGNEWQNVDNIQAYTDDNKTEYITKFYINGKVTTRKIYTADGMELESSLNHRYRVVNNNGEYVWKTVDDLEIGDRLAVKLGNHPVMENTPLEQVDNLCITQPSKMNTDIGFFLGVLFKHGKVDTENGSMCIHMNNTYTSKWLANFLKYTFAIRCSINQNGIYTTNTDFVKWLEFHNCLNKTHVPKIIRTAGYDIVEAFIKGMWERITDEVFMTEQYAREMLSLCRVMGHNVFLKPVLGQWCLYFRVYQENCRMWNGFWLDPITSLSESECDTYDIEVENAHHYRIGSVISHNTLSLLGNCTPGVHPGYAKYYIRRVRIASESPLVKLAKKYKYPVEYVRNFDNSIDHSTQIISFPFSLPDGTVLAKDCSAIDQLEYVKRLQTDWSDNSVSVTVYYRKHELPAIKEWLRNNYNNSVKTVSFLLHNEHGFAQAPMEEITQEEFERLTVLCKPVLDTAGICYHDEDITLVGAMECAGSSCPIK